MKTFVNITALILLASALGGCPSASKLLEGNSGGGGGGGLPVTTLDGGAVTLTGVAPKAKTGATAISLKYNQKFDVMSCADAPNVDECDGPTDRYETNSVVNLNRGAIVAATVTENADKTQASATVDGAAFVTDVAADGSGGVDPQTGLRDKNYMTENETENSFEAAELSINRIDGEDDFFFFEVDKAQGQITENKGNFDATIVRGVGGTLATADKVKTATYKGKAVASVDIGTSNDGYEGGFLGDSEITANLTTNKLDAKLIATNGVTDKNTGAVDGVGTVVGLTGADIIGNTFGGGKVSLNKADGSVLGTFADGDATSAGGFYGTNAEHVAGVLLGVGEFKDADGSTNSIFLSSDFWGTVEPEIVATTE